jgi:prolyl oligopeptidase
VEIREFDTSAKAFVKDGFFLPQSKGGVEWRDADTLYIARDFGPGTMNHVRLSAHRQGVETRHPMADARTIFEGKEADVGVGAQVVNEKGTALRAPAAQHRLLEARGVPARGRTLGPARCAARRENRDPRGPADRRAQDGLETRKRRLQSRALIATGLDEFMAGKRDFETIFEPRERVALQGYAATRGFLVLDILDNVKGRIVEVRREGSKWVSRDAAVPPAASIGVSAVDRDETDDYWMTVTSFIEPTTLYRATPGKDAREKLKSLPAFFDTKGLTVSQFEAASRDGTRVPYFVVMREGTKLDGSNPAILYGYGGFEIAMTPNYSGTIGSAWLERGGIWILANIRGGGEFGPQWHLTALREGRRKTHDDFIAVAEDLEKRGISSPKHLGIMGGSQGGLLVGAAFTQRPELFRAVVCQVPLLDMRRYNKLLAGASWMGEYGNPDDPKDWEFISTYSPYQNVVKDKKYPRIFFFTSTRDDRVHPGHARKMVAKMKEQNHDVLYYENIEGGHAGAVTPAQQAYMWALTYTFFLNELR